LHVFAKLVEDGLERRFEAEAFSLHQIGEYEAESATTQIL
jgi:hypothetical protein